MNRSIRTFVGGLALGSAALSAGCGGSSGGAGATCGKVEPCGGAVVGSWKVSASCFDTTALTISTCPQATFDTSGMKVSGVAAYNADLSYSSTVTTSGSATVTLPATCLMVGGVTVTCAQFDALEKAGVAANTEPTIQSVSCVSAGTACQCTAVANLTTMSETGTYVTAGSTLTSTPSDGTAPSDDGYCVQGTSLHVVSIDTTMNMGPMGQATITSDIVLTKQ